VAVCANFTGARRGELVEYLRPYRPSDIDGHPWKDWALEDEGGQRRPGGLSRWSQGKDLAWERWVLLIDLRGCAGDPTHALFGS
jgi:hypothetical protein